MFGLDPTSLALKAGVVVALMASAAWGGHVVTSNAWKAGQLVAEQHAVAAYKADLMRDNKTAAAYEAQKEQTRVEYEILTRYVDRIVEKPVYRDVCLDDDGLRAANSGRAGQPAGVPEPAGGVPPAAAPVGRK